MKCPKCGYELTEGHLYCDVCGEEMRMVPDFEPEIEQEMHEALSSLAVELAEDHMPAVHKEKEIIPDAGTDKPKKARLRGILIAVLAAAALLASLFFNYLYHTYSVTYQMKKAEECAGAEKYEQAVGYLEKAYALDQENADILFLMADYYYIQRKYDVAQESLQRIISTPDMYEEGDLESAYDKTISIYKQQSEYQKINELLLSCSNENIVTTFQQYIARPPEFSYVEGNYDEILPLKLSANTSGKIYYTLDGSIPDSDSEIYTAPIFLETGIYTVRAMFVNDFGIMSDIANNHYQIDLMVPPAPEISVYSGDYYEPNMIEASAPEGCMIFYTTDSVDPTADSIPYTAAIPMPLGKSVYKFIAISEEGVTSDITIRTYKLTLHTEITVDMAAGYVIQALIKENVLLDEQGSLRGMGGHNIYQYHAIVRIDGADYYVLYEYYEDATGISTKTDRIYAVNIMDGSPWRVTYDDAGKITLLAMGEPESIPLVDQTGDSQE